MVNRGKYNTAVALVLLVAATFAVYAANIGTGTFIDWDDNLYVQDNPFIQGFSFEHFRVVFSQFFVGNYAPLHLVSYMLDHTLWGLNPRGYIFTNVLLHAANGILFYVLFLRVSGHKAWAVVAAALFLFHPVQVESVAWISQRKTVLAMLFFLLAFHFYVSYREAGKGRGYAYFALSLAAFASSLLTKSVAVIFPVLIILYDYCMSERKSLTGLLRDKVPYVLTAAVVGAVAIWSQSEQGGTTGYYGGSLLATFFTMLPVLWRYMGLLLWPTNLSVLYAPPIKTVPDVAVVLAGVFALVLILIGVVLHRRSKRLFFWYMLFFVGLIPVSQIVPIVTLMNDRYLYFPMLGAAGFFAESALLIAGGNLRYRLPIAIVAVFLVAPLPLLSAQRAAVWIDSIPLWLDTIKKSPDDARAYASLGSSYYLRNQYLKAQEAYGRAVALDPKLAFAWGGLGSSHLKSGRRNEARACYQRALAENPNSQEALFQMGVMLSQEGDLEKGRVLLRKVVDLYPDFRSGLMALGINYYQAGNLPEAEGVLVRYRQLSPRSPQGLMLLGTVYLGMKKLEQAEAIYLEARYIGGDCGEIEYSLACVKTLQGNLPEGVAHVEAAFRCGFRDLHRIESNPELAPLRRDSRFIQLMRSQRTS